MARTPDPTRRSARAAEAILSAAKDLCRERGYGHVTIEAIAARAGVGKQTIYRWWPSKGAILVDVFMASLPQPAESDLATDIESALRTRLRAFVRAVRKKDVGPHIAALVGEAQVDPHVARQLQERFIGPSRRQHVELVARAQAQGVLRADIDAETILNFLYGPVWVRLLVTGEPITLAFADAILELTMTATRPREDSSTMSST